MKKHVKTVLGTLGMICVASLAFAADASGSTSGSGAQMAIAIAAGFGVAIAVVGATTGQSRAAVAFMEGISRNPNAGGQMFAPLLLSLAFMEALGILAWLISFLLQGKI